MCDICILTYYKNTFHRGVSNDGGSHVETSLICAVPLGVAEMCTRGSQVQPLLITNIEMVRIFLIQVATKEKHKKNRCGF